MANQEPATKADIESVVLLLQRMNDRMDHRFEAIENRLDRISDTLVGVQSQMAAVTRWSDRLDRDHGANLGTQAAQRRAMDDLAARVTRLEQRSRN